MSKSTLFGRRVHIAGSISVDDAYAKSEEVERARELIGALVKELLCKGATFVIPVDAEKTRPSDNQPICFDWLIWETIHKNLSLRPTGAPNPLVIAVKHHKNEEQIPQEFVGMWDALRDSALIQIQSAAHWNMNSKRMEMQALHGDILIALGGAEGVLFLANLYHDSGKPVIPLNLKLSPTNTGAQRLFDFGLSSNYAERLFQTTDGVPAHSWLNKIDFPNRKTTDDRKSSLIALLEVLTPPKAFVVRLLDPTHPDYSDVQNYFCSIVQPVLEDEFGYRLTVVDGKQSFDHSRIDQEIFAKLHRSRVVVADITGLRPNCFLELGYALGRSLPTVLLARDGTDHPFDIKTFSAHHWKATGSINDRRNLFREHWKAIQSRPSLVPTESIIP